MRKDKPLIQGILSNVERREITSSEKEKVVNRITHKLDTFITERGGWDSENNKVNNIGTFPIFDGDESEGQFYNVNINYEIYKNRDVLLPDALKVKVSENADPHNETSLLTITRAENMGIQLFRIEDLRGREINKIPELKKIEKLVDRILVYGRKHIHPIEKSASTSQ